MTYEEKRALYIAFSQILTDAGLNTQTIKEIALQEIQNKVDRAVKQAMKSLDSESIRGNYVQDRIHSILTNDYVMKRNVEDTIKKELSNRMIKVVFADNVEEDKGE